MKKMKSLVAAFTLAAAGLVTMGASTAEAQTVPVYGNGQVYNQANTGAAVSQGAIDDLAYNVGVQTIYYRTGSGFTQGTAQDGENIGLEFQLTGSNATVVRAYNLNDPNARYQFQQQVNYAAANEQRLADQEYRAQTRVYTYYEPQSYVICAPVVPIIGIGWMIGGWYPGYVPVYHHWNGFWDGYGHRNYNYNNHNTTIINNNTYINNGHGGDHRGDHGGQWNGGGQRGGGPNQWHNQAPPQQQRGNQNQWHNQVPPQQQRGNQGTWGGARERHDVPVVRQPVQQQHVETHQAMPRYEAPQRVAQAPAIHQGGGAVVRGGPAMGGGHHR